jgi:hypothetical protein
VLLQGCCGFVVSSFWSRGSLAISPLRAEVSVVDVEVEGMGLGELVVVEVRFRMGSRRCEEETKVALITAMSGLHSIASPAKEIALSQQQTAVSARRGSYRRMLSGNEMLPSDTGFNFPTTAPADGLQLWRQPRYPSTMLTRLIGRGTLTNNPFIVPQLR